jgi:hypothetical protein
MKLLRIKANYTENKREYFILTVLIDDQYNLITDTEMFGYVVDECENGLAKYPFIITASTNKNFSILNYGADSEYATSKINLPMKNIAIGEYFTRWEEGEEEEYVYIIENIIEIIS